MTLSSSLMLARPSERMQRYQDVKSISKGVETDSENSQIRDGSLFCDIGQR
jgi:hypothetical protein